MQVQLDLSSNDLEGRIPPSLSALADLHALLLQDNMLQGQRFRSSSLLRGPAASLFHPPLACAVSDAEPVRRFPRNWARYAYSTDLFQATCGPDLATPCRRNRAWCLRSSPRCPTLSPAVRRAGGIPEDLFGASMRQLSRVDLSSNLLTGHVPLGVCRLDHLVCTRPPIMMTTVVVVLLVVEVGVGVLAGRQRFSSRTVHRLRLMPLLLLYCSWSVS